MIVAFDKAKDLSDLRNLLLEVANTNTAFYSCSYERNQQQINENNNTTYFNHLGMTFKEGKTFYLMNTTDSADISIILNLLESYKQSNIVNIFTQITDIHSSYRSWGACFDLINTYLIENTMIILSPCDGMSDTNDSNTFISCFPHHFLCEPSDYQSDFSLDGGLWSIKIHQVEAIEPTTPPPPSTSAPSAVPNVLPAPGPQSVSPTAAVPIAIQHAANEDDGWDIVHMDEGLAALSIDDVVIVNNNSHTHSPSPHLPADHAGSEEACHTTTATTNEEDINTVKLSYREAILKPLPPPLIPKPENGHRSGPENRAKWRPIIVTTAPVPYIRADRLYGPQPDQYIDDGMYHVYELIMRLVYMSYTTYTTLVKLCTVYFTNYILAKKHIQPTNIYTSSLTYIHIYIYTYTYIQVTVAGIWSTHRLYSNTRQQLPKKGQ